LTYPELLADLYAARRGGVRLDLERIHRLLAALGDPQRGFASVIVGGTNGKGSTAAMIASVLTAAGARTALYTSPHLSRFAERFAVDGQPLAPAALVSAGEAVAGACARVGGDPPTFFERVTAMALHGFAAAEVDVAVLEVGMGGRFDATNAVAPAVACVTGVALDHQQYLGERLEQIAAEKAGIFRAGVPAIIGAGGEPAAVPWLVAAAERVGARVVRVDAAAIAAVPPRLGLAGDHQRVNAAAALAVVRALDEAGVVGASEAAIAAGLAGARLPGRFETLSERPCLVVDGAHNPHAAATLMAGLAGQRAAGGRLVLVVGVSADKDVDQVLAALAGPADAVVLTRSRSDRAAPIDALVAALARVHPGLEPLGSRSVAEAVDVARRLAGPDDLILVAGSLFVAGEAREAVLGEPGDDVDLTDPLGVGGPGRAG